jgi:hypothetical protein
MDLRLFLTRQYTFESSLHRHLLEQVLAGLTEEELNWQPRPGHHSIWHNVWHMWLSHDYYFSDAFETRAIWDVGRWSERMDLTPMAQAFAHEGNAAGGCVPRFVIADVPDSLVDELKAVRLSDFLAYVDDLLGRTREFVAATTEEQLTRKVDWYGGMKLPAHAVGLGYSHVARHLGMVEDLRGLLRGPGSGTASI